MGLTLKESRACVEMARLLYNFLPGAGAPMWKGHISFKTVAKEVGVGEFWQGGSKEPAIAILLEKTLQYHRDLFETLVLGIVKAALKYREKEGRPITEKEIETLNGLILDIGFKFPDLWDSHFLNSLKLNGASRAANLIEQEHQKEKIEQVHQSNFEYNLKKIRDTFYALNELENRQDAGLNLERVLNDLFRLFKLEPRESFRVFGEQIDGSFELDNEVYLLEAKWEKDKLSEAPLMIFREKVQGKSSITRGLFIALNGCTTQAFDAITRGKQPNFFFMDGYDLSIVLEGRIGLDILLRKKIRCLAEEGNIFYSAARML